LEGRLKIIRSRALRQIGLILIDGNNLCYQEETFIRLAALKPLTSALLDKYPLIVVFDASIRGLMQMGHEMIANEFDRRVQVHVVATRQLADETLLDAASQPEAYVISNDRFREFVEKPVVQNGRLLRHEIVNGKVFVHDLNIAAKLA
jgi:rRNA-processing protein FCF1